MQDGGGTNCDAPQVHGSRSMIANPGKYPNSRRQAKFVGTAQDPVRVHAATNNNK